MVKKYFLIVFLSIFLFVSVLQNKGFCDREGENAVKAVTLIAFLLIMGKYVYPYYGQNTVQIKAKSGNYEYRNPGWVLEKDYEICSLKEKIFKGPPGNVDFYSNWACRKTVRIRKYYERGRDKERLLIRTGFKDYEVERFRILPGYKILDDECNTRKLNFSLEGSDLVGRWYCY